MSNHEESTLSVTAKVKIFKYAEGVTPENGKPFEVVEEEQVFTGKDAAELRRVMKEAGYDVTT